MTGTRPRLWLLLAAALTIGLPFFARWHRPRSDGRCALDGLKIEPLYQVRVVADDGTTRRFCCVRCAERWLALADAVPRAVHVTDEASGEEIDARSAWFVLSPVLTNPITRNRVHVFARRDDAEAHARAFGGQLLDEPERPLQVKAYSDRD